MPHEHGLLQPINFEDVFRALLDCYLLVDTDFRVVAASDAFFQTTMTHREKVIGQPVFVVFPDNPDVPNVSASRSVAQALEKVIQSHQAEVLALHQYDIRRPDGTFEERYWNAVYSPISAADGVTVEYISIRIENVTQFVLHKRRRMGQGGLAQQILPPWTPGNEAEFYLNAQEVYEANRRLENANQHLKTLYAQARELNQIKTQFFANVSHELRTPLTLILGPIRQLLHSRQWSEQDQHTFEVIGRNAQALLSYINDLLDVIRLETSQVIVNYADIDCVQLLQAAMGQFELLAQSRHVILTLYAPKTLKCHTDPEKVLRICVNLLSNAFKFVPDGGEIRITLDLDGKYLRIRIADNGPGIKPELRDLIFERFNLGENGNVTPSGSGLGLAICKEMTKLLKGDILATNSRGAGGALFEITIPRWAPPDVPVTSVTHFSVPEVPPSPAVTLEAVNSNARSPVPASRMDDCPLVLIVEDHPDMSRFIADVLAAHYRTEIACDGLTGLDKALALQPDLVLTDIMMPEMSGERLVRQLRCHPQLDNTPVVLLSARSDEIYRTELLLAGAQDYLTKPFSAQELLARIANQITMKRTRELLQAELTSREQDVLTLVQELTLRKHELEKLAEEQQHTAQCLRQQASALVEASRYKSDFLAKMSHELRTPLNCILILSEQLAHNCNPNLSEPQMRHAQMIFKAGSDLLALVNDILDISAMGHGKLSLKLGQVTVAELAASLESALLPLASGKGLIGEISIQAGAPTKIWSDFHRVSQVLKILADNAVKFTTEGSVRIHFMPSERDPLALEVAVIDTGPGIARDKHELIFQAFEKANDDVGHHTGGAGLGLNVAKQLTRLLGGYLTVKSAPGYGSTFILGLPAAVPEK